MSSKLFFLVLGGLVIIIGGYFFFTASAALKEGDDNGRVVSPATETGEVPGAVSVPNTEANTAEVKEFTMRSWMDKIDGTMAAHFSLPEIVVKKGDLVRIKITNTAGTHDFVIDEYGVNKDTPVDQETIVEFVADKVGSFEYYCSKYNHRALGQRGTLRVTE